MGPETDKKKDFVKTRVPHLSDGGANRLSLFCDISGKFCEESQRNKSFTGAGVVIATSDETTIRTSLGKNIPKWKNSEPASLSLIGDVLEAFDVHCVAVKLRKTEPAWTRFWKDGTQCHREFLSVTKSKAGFVKSGNVLRGLMLGKCCAISLGSRIHARGKPTILGPDGLSVLYVRITCDTDLENQESQEAFRWSWARLCERTRLSTLFGIKPHVDTIEFTTEQDESLLLLSDYLAGYVQYSSDKTGCIPLPAGLSCKDAERFGQMLSRLRTLGRFISVEQPFNKEFPKLGLR